jgi:hypothetical protein
MVTENRRSKAGRVSIVLVGILLASMLSIGGVASELSGVKIVNPSHGYANVKGEAASYYYYRSKIAADTETSVIFKQNTCSVSDQKSKKFSKCWIHIAGASAGLSFSKQAPISMKTLSVEPEGGKSSEILQWNTLMIDGPEGAIEFKIPRGGYVELNFLWEVPKEFSPSRVKIGDLVDVSL